MFLNWAALAVSFFNAISLLWLGLMVFLSGSRKSVGTLLAGGGLLLAALFFISHTAILGRGISDISYGMDFWWWVSWTPAVVAPLVWYAAMLWYNGFRLDRPHPHQPWLAGVGALAVTIAGLLIYANPLPSYQEVVGRDLIETPSLAGIPALVLAYLLFSLLCYLLPLDLLRRAEKLDKISSTAGGLQLAAVARRRARPLLAGATLSLLLAALGMVWTVLWALNSIPVPSLRNLPDLETVLGFDLGVDCLVALAITLMGRAVVAYEVFTGRPLPRTGFFRQWRSTVLLAGGYGVVAAWTLTIQLRALYGLMMATALVTVFYALYSWRSFAEREHFMERLRPFIASQNLYGQMLESGPQLPSSIGTDLFDTLCGEVLAVQSAALVPAGALAALAGPPLVYAPSAAAESQSPAADPAVAELAGQFSSPDLLCLPAGVLGHIGAASGLAWAVSLWNERGLGGLLLLGEKVDCNPFTQEEMEIAQAGGERLLDMLAGVEMARLSMDLLRQRLSQQRVLEGRSRRVLHDEVLPELHTAILYLSGQQDTLEIREAVATLAKAHRSISDLMRDSLPNVPQRLEQGGLVQALQALLEGDLAGEFDAVEWQVDAAANEALGRFPLLVSEVVYFAGRELLRNAARHGRGGASDRPLKLTVTLEQKDGLRLVVADDGVGMSPSASQGYPAAGGAGSGLKFHSTMLAAVGASMEVGSLPGSGTRGVIVFPEEKA
ncbi:MAG: hypothetical protein P4L50_10850 [Anaerolineaceae bacterium]|nr:hypothetical protein [Anaerolineaceae bacterium]